MTGMVASWVAALGVLEPTAAPVAEPPKPAIEGGWYGGPAVGFDVVASVVTVVGLAEPDHAGIIPGGVVYGLGAPINHLLHGHPGRAAISFGTRVLAGALVWPTLDDHILVCDAPTCHDPGKPLTLAAIFMAGVMAADDLWLAREPAAPALPRGTMLAPGVIAKPGTALLSLTGRF